MCSVERQTVQFLVNDEEQDTSSFSAVEVIAPSVMMQMEKFVVKNDSPAKNFVGFRVKSVSDCRLQSAARFLALTVDHIDTLLGDWYPGLDTTNMFGENLVTRLIPCQKCVNRVISLGSSPSPCRQPRSPGNKRRAEDESCNGDENNQTPSPFRQSTFYLRTPEYDNYETTTQDEGSPRDEPRESTSPSSDSGSSSGLGTDNSFATIDPDDSSEESSPVSQSVNPNDSPFVQRNECEQDTTDSEAERSRASSQTSGVPPSPRHGSGLGERVIATFDFEECVVISHKTDHVTCRVDGDLLLKDIAPDVVSGSS